MKRIMVMVVGALLLSLPGCVGDGSFTDQVIGPPDPGPGTPPGSPTASYTEIATTIFEVRCTKCHSGANAPLGLQLTQAAAYDLLVNVSSAERPELFRVEPGNPDDSYIVIKIEGTDPRLVDRRMPRDGPPFLTTEQITMVRDWISSGAPRN